MIMINTFIKNSPKQFFGGTALFYCIAALEACGSNRQPNITSGSREGGLCLLPPIKLKI